MLLYKKLQDFKELNLPGSGLFFWNKNHPHPNRNHINYYRNSKNPSDRFLRTNVNVFKQQQISSRGVISQKRAIPVFNSSIHLSLLVTLQIAIESWGKNAWENAEYLPCKHV